MPVPACNSVRQALVMGLLALQAASVFSATAEDRREMVARESQRYRSQYFPDGCLPPKRVWKQPPSAQSAPADLKDIPGGVGYGYYFNSSSLLWTNCSVADYYVIAPSFLGGTVSTLYLTSTCRAQLGTESLVSYQGTGEAQFWIYDWSQVSTNPWQVFMDLPTQNPQYLTNRPDEFGITRQMIHVRNGVYYLGLSNGLYNWQNQSLLFNFLRGDWDFIYSRNYTTSNLNDNLPTASGDPVGFWGPIVETYNAYTNVNPVGFDLVRLFQDGNVAPFWLTPANSFVQSANNWTLLTQAQNTSFTVAVGSNFQSGGSYNVGSLCVTANIDAASFSLNPSGGSRSANWIITPNSNRWDQTVVGLTPGTYTITFNPVPGAVAPGPQVFAISSNTISTVQAVYLWPPILLGESLRGQSLVCNWGVHSNLSYQLQYTTNLASTNWLPSGSPFLATTPVVATSNAVSFSAPWFARLALAP